MLTFLKYPYLLFALIPLAAIIFYIINKSVLNRKPLSRLVKSLLFASRMVICILIFIALATPNFIFEKNVESGEFVKIIVDNTTSMKILDTGFVNGLVDELGDRIDVKVEYINGESALGDAIMGNVKENENLLLISDGNNVKGAALDDAAFFVSGLNSSISAVKLSEIKNDAGVYVEGPNKAIEGVDNTFTVKANIAGEDKKYDIVVDVDGSIEAEKNTDKEFSFNRKFDVGYHKITAKIVNEDEISENNIYYKTVKVIGRPKILFASSRESPLFSFLNQIYDAKWADIEELNDDYSAVVINNIGAKSISNAEVDKLTDFISKGNGMLVVGGSESYEKGNYKDSLFETLLPVYVAAPGKKEGEVNIIIVIDISASTGSQLGSGAAVDVEKALAVSVLDGLRSDDLVGAVAFNTESYVVAHPDYLSENKGELIDSISRLHDGGGTIIAAGLSKAINILSSMGGSKNIILISDGKTKFENLAYSAAKEANEQGIKIYTVGVGSSTNSGVMNTIADITNGIYFKADDSSKLKIIFGDIKKGDEHKYGLVLLNKNHFITGDLDIDTFVYGFNQVVPKSAAQMLITTDKGDPVLTVWRFGLGRIASFTSDDGTDYAGLLLTKKNSPMMGRTVSWLVGDPERNEKSFVNIEDTSLNELTKIIVKNNKFPVADGLSFYKISDDLYGADILGSELGFNSAYNAVYAVNYNDEFRDIGFNENLKNIAENTNGRLFENADADEIEEFARTLANRKARQRSELRWPFALAALIIFLTEICIRRLFRKEEQ